MPLTHLYTYSIVHWLTSLHFDYLLTSLFIYLRIYSINYIHKLTHTFAYVMYLLTYTYSLTHSLTHSFTCFSLTPWLTYSPTHSTYSFTRLLTYPLSIHLLVLPPSPSLPPSLSFFCTGHIAAGQSLDMKDEFDRAVKWLSTSHRRLAAVLILRQLALNTPSLFNVYVCMFYSLMLSPYIIDWIGLLTHSLTHSTYSLTHSLKILTHSLTYSLAHTLTYSLLTHSRSVVPHTTLHTYIDRTTHTCMHICINFTYICIHVYLPTYIPRDIHTYTHTHTYICTYVQLSSHTHISCMHA